jgi:hypothetical protein
MYYRHMPSLQPTQRRRIIVFFYSVHLLKEPWHTCLCLSWTRMLVRDQSSQPLKCHRGSASFDARQQLHIGRGMLNIMSEAHIVKHESKSALPAFTYVWDWMSHARGQIMSKYLLKSVGYPYIRLSYSFTTIENLKRTSLKFGTLSWSAKRERHTTVPLPLEQSAWSPTMWD